MLSNAVPTGSPHLIEVLPQNRFICTYLGPNQILLSKTDSTVITEQEK